MELILHCDGDSLILGMVRGDCDGCDHQPWQCRWNGADDGDWVSDDDDKHGTRLPCGNTNNDSRRGWQGVIYFHRNGINKHKHGEGLDA